MYTHTCIIGGFCDIQRSDLDVMILVNSKLCTIIRLYQFFSILPWTNIGQLSGLECIYLITPINVHAFLTDLDLSKRD